MRLIFYVTPHPRFPVRRMKLSHFRFLQPVKDRPPPTAPKQCFSMANDELEHGTSNRMTPLEIKPDDDEDDDADNENYSVDDDMGLFDRLVGVTNDKKEDSSFSDDGANTRSLVTTMNECLHRRGYIMRNVPDRHPNAIEN